jgi:hypothetical protein
VVKNSFQRVALREYTEACFQNNSLNLDGYGLVDCDFPPQNLLKLYRAGPAFANNMVYGDVITLIKAFGLKTSDQTEMLAQVSDDHSFWDVSVFRSFHCHNYN